MDKAPPAPRRVTRPLLVREGARFQCSGSGACCSDLHRLGPLSTRDVVRLRRSHSADVIVEHVEGEPELVCTSEGVCVFLNGTLCSLQTAGGADAKPGVCRRFPFELVATPMGGRVVTSHRCPCRTMGDRALISPEDAEAALIEPRRAAKGADPARPPRLSPTREAPSRVPLTARTNVSFERWAALEAPLIRQLAAGEAPSRVLRVPAGLPPLAVHPWRDVAASFAAFGAYPHRGYQAMAWFADGISLALGEPVPPRARPWSDGFDRAEACAPDPGPSPDTAARVIGDWLADLVWGLEFLERGPFDLARTSLGALAEIAYRLAGHAMSLGLRADRAAAEAVMITELASAHPRWAMVVAQMEPARGFWSRDTGSDGPSRAL